MKRSVRHFVLLTAALCGLTSSLRAQEIEVQEPLYPDAGVVYPMPWAPREERVLPSQEDFPRGIWNFQFRTGPYFSPVANIGPEQPTYNFMVQGFRLGRTTVLGFQNGLLRGSLEPVMELLVGESLTDLGNIFIGPTWMLRYNFVQPEARLVPYYQMGVGVQYNDAYKVQNQNSLGQSMLFHIQAQVGARYFVGERSSIDLEGGYIHISNANMNDRNGGINAFGFTLGFSHFFGRPYRPDR